MIALVTKKSSEFTCATRIAMLTVRSSWKVQAYCHDRSSMYADRNWRRFVLFRLVFNSRFYYPVLAVLFLDLGLTATRISRLA